MQSKCGQCHKAYSQECSKTFKCAYHHGQCFSCKPCKKDPLQPHPPLVQCSLCPVLAPSDDLYFQFCCGKYFCCRHFLKKNFFEKEMRLPCGCMVDSEHVTGFMNNFCFHCGRKLADKTIYQLSLCEVCANKQNCSDRSLSNYLPKLGCKSEKQKSSDNEYKNLVNCYASEPPERSQSSHMEALRILQSQLEDLHEKYEVADHSRKLIKRSFMNEGRDRECPICYLEFNLLDKRPMMICLQQHLICHHCFKKETLLVCCPLCRQPIKKEQVIVSREKIINMELEDLVTRKYEAARKTFTAEKEKKEIEEKAEKGKEGEEKAKVGEAVKMVSVQVQTDPVEEAVQVGKGRKRQPKKPK